MVHAFWAYAGVALMAFMLLAVVVCLSVLLYLVQTNSTSKKLLVVLTLVSLSLSALLAISLLVHLISAVSL